MNRSYLSTIALAVAALTAGQAFAANASSAKTREQVKAELTEAVRTGNIMANGDSGQMLNDGFPDRYPAKPVVQGKTRAQVQAELAEAIRTGDIVGDESGKKLNELYPGRYKTAH